MAVDYSPELALRICERIAEGELLKHICAARDMPNRTTVWRWAQAHPEFGEWLSNARQLHAEGLFDEAQDIADTDPDPQRARNRIDVRKWRAAVINPQRYGPKMDVNITERVDWAAARRQALARLPIARRAALENQPPLAEDAFSRPAILAEQAPSVDPEEDIFS